MVDTTIMVGEVSEVGSRDVIIGKLENRITSTVPNSHLTSHTGYLNNLKVTIRDNEITIIGSLAEYRLGNNFAYLTRPLLKQTIEMLCDEVEVDVRFFRIYRVDISATLDLSSHISYYLPLLTYLSRYKTNPFFDPNNKYQSKNFYSSSKSVLFYDKLAQTKKKFKNDWEKFKQQGLPTSGNWLRFELQLKNKVMHHVGKELVVRDLYKKKIYRKLVRLWFQHYKKIKKEKVVLATKTGIKTKSQLIHALAYSWLAEHGNGEIIQVLERDKLAGKITPKNMSYMRAVLNKTESNLGHESQYIKELDKKVLGIARYQLNT